MDLPMYFKKDETSGTFSLVGGIHVFLWVDGSDRYSSPFFQDSRLEIVIFDLKKNMNTRLKPRNVIKE